MDASRKTTVSSSVAPMNSTGPCQAGGNHAPNGGDHLPRMMQQHLVHHQRQQQGQRHRSGNRQQRDDVRLQQAHGDETLSSAAMPPRSA